MAGENGSSKSPDTPERPQSPLSDLSGFQFDRILSDYPEDKKVVVCGKIIGKGNDEATAIVVVEKNPFAADKVKDYLDGNLKMKQQFQNDAYSMYDGHHTNEAANQLKVNVIWPASQKHMDKFTKTPVHVVNETPSMYNFITVPFLESQPSGTNEWIYNILDHKAETDRIVYEDSDPDTGFILAPDFKWASGLMEDFYCLAIVHARNIKSIRDLTPKHLPLLRKLLHDAPRAIKDKYGLEESKLRIYFHYQPTYYHLHVHYSHIEYKAPGTTAPKAHMLATVIDDLESGKSYGRATIPFTLNEGSKLHQAYVDAGYSFGDEKMESVTPVDDEEEIGKTLEFLRLLGKAKHEPCGEHWSSSFADSAWRMAVMAICLSPSLNRKHIVKIALSSALTSLGKDTDQNSTWAQKLAEVRSILSALLPWKLAAELYDLYVIHASARRGLTPKTPEERVYRKLLEMEEALLMCEEFQKENEEEASRLLLSKLVKAGFPGHEKYTMFGDSGDFQNLLTFIITISKLRCLKRTGWVKRGVRDPERVSGHMFRMGLMSIILENGADKPCPPLDRSSLLGETSVIVSVVHDIAECIVGDLIPSDPVTPEEKHKMETEAITSLVRNLPFSTHSKEIFDAFERYEMQRPDDEEARLTKNLDKFDMVLQAFEYEIGQGGSTGKKHDFLEEFFTSTEGFCDHPVVKKWDSFLRRARQEHLASVNNISCDSK